MTRLSDIARLACAGLAAGLLAACSGEGEPPYLLANWKRGDQSVYAVAAYAPQKGPNGKPTLSVCYSRQFHSVEEIRQLVTRNCTAPALLQNELDLDACSVTAPVRATFSCEALSRIASENRPNLRPTSAFSGSFNLWGD